MKKSIIFCLGTLLLAGCGSSRISAQLQERLKNPLYAEQYYDLLLDRMVDLKIKEDPMLKNAKKAKVVEDTRLAALMQTREANTAQRQGTIGNLISSSEEVGGEVLLTDSSLYLGPTFETYPGPSLHVLITTVVDPREGTFPDPTSIDLGAIEDPFGAQTLAVPTLENLTAYRTVVIWDTKLERLYGFAQLSK